MHGGKKSVRYFCLHLFSLTLDHGYSQASSESLDDQMPPAVAGATLSKLHVISDDTHGQSHAPATDGHQHAQNDVDRINETILKSFPGELKSYCNIDKIINILEAHHSSEYLYSINASGLPLSELNLKVGCPIVILCNLDPANGLCVVGGRMWQWGVGEWMSG